MKTPLLSLTVLLASLCATAPVHAATAAVEPEAPQVQVPVGIPSPAMQVRELLGFLRANDVATLVQTLTPPAHYRQLREAYEQHRAEPSTEAQRADFAEKIDRLIAADAVDTLMAEIEPQLQKGAAQSEGMILMGLGALNIAANSEDADLTPEQRVMIKRALPGLERWIISTDFFSADSMRDALSLLADAARRTGIRDLDQLKALPLEDALARAGVMLGAAKQALLIYGLDLDAIAATTRVDLLSLEGDSARIRTTITLFDAPISTEQDLVLLEGRWYSREALENWELKPTHKAKHKAHSHG